MFQLADHALKDLLLSVLVFASLAMISNRLAYKNKLLFLPSEVSKKIHLRFLQVCAVFSIYLVINLGILPLISHYTFSNAKGKALGVQEMIKLYLLTVILTFITLAIYLLVQNRHLIQRIWKDREFSPSSLLQDAGMGFLFYFIAFPLVMAVGGIVDFFLYLFFGFIQYEQAAVNFLRLAQQTPFTLTIAIFTIIVAAPLIEELLFRGFLQTWLKNKMGRKASITLSSLAFALFHIGPSQGYGNFTLLISLFTFSLYLGFLYEKQRSLLAPIVLHALFNTVSTLRILMMME